MILNFFKITFRNFKKNSSYVFINLLGLGISLALVIVAYLNYKYSADYDKNHENYKRIYKIHFNKIVEDQKMPFGITPIPLGAQLKDRYSEVEKVSRYANDELVLKENQKLISKSIAFVEEDFLEMFTFPLKSGSKDALNDPSKILITNELAKAHFGEKNAIGKTITAITRDGNQIPMTIGAVLEDIPKNSSMTFQVLTNFKNSEKLSKRDPNDWARFIAATWIMTKDKTFPGEVLNDLNENFVEVQNQSRKNLQVSEYSLINLEDLGQTVLSPTLRYNWLNEPPPTPAVTVPLIMSAFTLLIACFNFTNTSIAISSKRLKEIGIRKVMGSNRGQLIFQFMGENFMLSLLSMILAIFFASYITPLYSALWNFINLELDLQSDPEIFVFLFGLLVITSIIAGAYPSLYISKYQPVNILRGSLTLGGANLFSKFLLGTQYLLTIVALISSLAFINNAKYQSNLDMGFTKENTISISVNDKNEYEKYFNLLSEMPEIQKAVGTTNHIGQWDYSRTMRIGQSEIEASMMNFSLEYPELMDLEIVSGRYFDPKLFEYDRQNSILVNEALVKEAGWKNPIGKVVQINDTTRLNVIGVMKDFYMNGFFSPVKSTGFRLARKDYYNFVVIRSDTDPVILYEKLESAWYEIAPNTIFNAEFQNQDIGEVIQVNKNISKMFIFMSIICFLLSSIGLYTLVSLNVIKKVKEIGVRKVLGASINQIVVMISKKFYWLLFLAISIGSIISYFSIDSLMSSIFSVYQALNIYTVLLPFISLAFLALIIAATRILITATKNPVESLRYE